MTKEFSKKIFKKFANLGGFQFAKFIARNSPRILMYHRFKDSSGWRGLDVAIFEEQIKTLRKKCNIVSLKTLCTLLTIGDKIPSNITVLTIDDGYQDFYTFAYPILKRYSVPATIYVTTDFVDKKIWLWPDVIEFILNKTRYENYSLTLDRKANQYILADKLNRLKAWNDIADYCLTLKNENKKEFIKQLAYDLKVSVPSVPVPEYQSLSWEQIREMKQNNIEIGSHTCTHSRLVMTDYPYLFYEIKASKSRIENMLDEPVESFCYPHGTRDDLNEGIKCLVKENGYKNATVAYVDSDTTGDLYSLKRYGIGEDMLHFSKVIYGVEYMLMGLEKILKRLIPNFT